MSEEEYLECSVVAYPRQIKFLHINGGAISYYVDRHVSDYVNRLQQENEKLHHYKTLYQSLKCQKEELKSWLEEKIQNIDTIYLGAARKNYSDDMILDMSSRKWRYKDTLNKLEELEGVNDE